jgi:hypothetical protein
MTRSGKTKRFGDGTETQSKTGDERTEARLIMGRGDGQADFRFESQNPLKQVTSQVHVKSS